VVQVDAPEALHRGRDVTLDVLLERDVSGDRRGLAGQRRGDLVGPRAVEVDDDHQRALLGEPARRRPADPARAAGHDGDPAREAAVAHAATVASIQRAIGSRASALFFSSIIAWPLPFTP
jgi:hypothetical protein